MVLAARHGGPWRASNFDRIWRRFKEQQGFACRFHDLRQRCRRESSVLSVLPPQPPVSPYGEATTQPV
jgi:hypothetical protein